MASNLTDIKSPLVLVRSFKRCRQIAQWFKHLWTGSPWSHGISAHISLRDETAAIYVSLAKFSSTSPCSHRTFPFSKKAKRNKSLTIAPQSLTGLLVNSQVKFDNINQFLRLQNSPHLSHTGFASSLLLHIATNPSFALVR